MTFFEWGVLILLVLNLIVLRQGQHTVAKNQVALAKNQVAIYNEIRKARK